VIENNSGLKRNNPVWDQHKKNEAQLTALWHNIDYHREKKKDIFPHFLKINQ